MASALEILAGAGAVIRGDHFVYVTGEHGDGWIDKDAIFPNTGQVDELCRMLAEAVAIVGSSTSAGRRPAA